MKKTIPLFALTACSVFLSGLAQAHYLWLEPAEAGARLYYGEADVLLREKSPGKLDNFKAPLAFVPDAAGKFQSVAVSGTPDYFAVAAPKSSSAIVVQDESLDVRDLTKSGLGFAKSNYYARHGQLASNGGAMLALDAVGGGFNKFAIFYRGQPLKDAKVEVIAPNTWTQEHKTDAKGSVEINAPWKGQYVVHVLHIDKTPGQHAGKTYESLRNHLTYSFVKTDGADPGPAVPPKHFED
jgi:uncharacterized GH25 family protein